MDDTDNTRNITSESLDNVQQKDTFVVLPHLIFKPDCANVGFLAVMVRARHALQAPGCLSYDIHVSQDQGKERQEVLGLTEWENEEKYRSFLTSGPSLQYLAEHGTQYTQPYIPTLWLKRADPDRTVSPSAIGAFAVLMKTVPIPEKRNEYASRLMQSRERVRRKSGFISFDILEGQDKFGNGDTIIIYALFHTVEDYENHCKCVDGGLLTREALDLCTKNPDVTTWQRVEIPT